MYSVPSLTVQMLPKQIHISCLYKLMAKTNKQKMNDKFNAPISRQKPFLQKGVPQNDWLMIFNVCEELYPVNYSAYKAFVK